MVIGDISGYSSLGLGSLRPQKPNVEERAPVTLDARLDPRAPNEYAVGPFPTIIPPPERPGDAKSAEKRTSQSNDPVSRAFLSVANYSPTIHRIDLEV